MLLLILSVAIAWLATIAIVVGMCVSASRSDRDQLRARRVTQARPGLQAVS